MKKIGKRYSINYTSVVLLIVYTIILQKLMGFSTILINLYCIWNFHNVTKHHFLGGFTFNKLNWIWTRLLNSKRRRKCKKQKTLKVKEKEKLWPRQNVLETVIILKWKRAYYTEKSQTVLNNKFYILFSEWNNHIQT